MATTPEFNKAWGETIADMLAKVEKHGKATVVMYTADGEGVRLTMEPYGSGVPKVKSIGTRFESW